MHFKLITHDRIVFDEEVNEIYTRAVDGDFGVLENHVPLMTALDVGVTKVVKGDEVYFFTTMGGIFQFKDNNAILLTDTAETGDDIDVARAKSALERAEARLADKSSEIDAKRAEQGLGRATFFWENVEGALTDKTNAFGCFLAGLAGLDEPVQVGKFKSAGVLYGPNRNIAWRVLDAKYFGVPQQRKRVYVLGGGLDFHPENILLEMGNRFQDPYKLREPQQQAVMDLFAEEEPEINQDVIRPLRRVINGHDIEVFRCYSDCLYAAYGTKWNGNAAAFNGSLYVSQDGRLRRLTPIECERLMGFPDNYTAIANPRLTNRYQATGNSWAVPVIRWIMNRLLDSVNNHSEFPVLLPAPTIANNDFTLYLLDDFTNVGGLFLNASNCCYDFVLTNMLDIVDTDPDENLYISAAGCAGILRRKREHNAGMNARLEIILENCAQ